jgi:hypothetical protein
MNVKVDDKLLREHGYEVAERAAILEFEAGFTREEAEAAAVEWARSAKNERQQ